MSQPASNEIVKNRSPLIIPVLSWITGFFLGKIYRPDLSIIFGIALCLLTLLFFNKKWRNLTIILLTVVTGWLFTEFKELKPPGHISYFLDQDSAGSYRISGIVQSTQQRLSSAQTSNNHRTVISLREINGLPTSGKVYLFSPCYSLKPGDKVTLQALVRNFRSATNPFSFNYADFMHSSGIYASAFLQGHIHHQKGQYLERSGFAGHSSYIKYKYLRALSSVRDYLIELIHNKIPGHSGLAKALLLGIRDDIGDYREMFRQAGLAHLLALSGFHTALISFILFTFLNIFIIKKNYVRFLLIVILFFYAAICNWAPTVMRAVIFLNIFYFSKIIQRRLNPFQILALTVFLISIIDYRAIFSVSLQLSVISVLSIFLYIYYLRSKFLKYPGFLSHSSSKLHIITIKGAVRVAELMLVSLIITLTISPLTIFYFQQLNLNGVIGNIAGSFLVAVIIPLMILILITPNFLFFPTIFLRALDFLIYLLSSWNNLISRLPFNFHPLSISVYNLILLLAIFSGFFYLITNLDRKRFTKRRLITFATLIAVLITGSVLYSAFTRPEFKAVMFDAGTADLNMIRYRNKTILIDTGLPENSYSHFKYTACPYFRRKGISHINWLFITHPHIDHYGGLDYIVNNYSVGNLVINRDFKTGLTEFYEQLSTQIRTIVIADTITLINDGLKLKVLHPDPVFDSNNLNENSLVIRVDYKNLSLLFTGDLEASGEAHLIDNYPQYLGVSILKAGHHGSRTSSTIEFLSLVQPEIVFIPTGIPNPYNFPHRGVLENLYLFTENVFISGCDGALMIYGRGRQKSYRTFLSNEQYYLENID